MERKVGLFVADVFDYHTIGSVGVVAGAVFAIAGYEARLTIKPCPKRTHIRYCLRYAARQVVPSIVWGTFKPLLVFKVL